MITFLRYLWEVLKHKYFIIVSGLRINQTLRSTSYQISYKRLIFHDLSKFGKAEFWPYAEHFCGSKRNSQQHDDSFHEAWLHHVAHNDHHYEHFISNYSEISKELRNYPELAQNYIREMPDDALLELVVDNIAATRSYEGYWPNGESKEGWTYMTKYFHNYILHPTTRIKFGALLCALGYAQVLPSAFDWSLIYSTNISPEDQRRLGELEGITKLNNSNRSSRKKQ